MIWATNLLTIMVAAIALAPCSCRSDKGVEESFNISESQLLEHALERMDTLNAMVQELKAHTEVLTERIERQEKIAAKVQLRLTELSVESTNKLQSSLLNNLVEELKRLKKAEHEEDLQDLKESQRQSDIAEELRIVKMKMKEEIEEDDLEDAQRDNFWLTKGGGVLIVLAILLWRQIKPENVDLSFGESTPPIELSRSTSNESFLDTDSVNPHPMLTPRKFTSIESGPKRLHKFASEVNKTVLAQRWLRKVRSKGTQGSGERNVIVRG